MVADKFNRYKTVLAASIACVVIFHTVLVHIDARVTPDGLLNNRRDSVEADIMCSRTGAIVNFENFTTFPQMFQQRLSVNWSVSDCRPIDCAIHQSLRVRMCFGMGNCSDLIDETVSSVSFMLAEADEKMAMREVAQTNEYSLSYELLDVYTESSAQSGTILCSCLASCPVTISLPEEPLDEATLNATLQLKEAERIKHNRGFWLYFFFRILASGSVSVAFSMYVNPFSGFPVCCECEIYFFFDVGWMQLL